MAEPIVISYPQTQSAFINKYRNLAPALPSIPPHIRNALIDFDLTRAQRGQPPLGMKQTALAIQAALTGGQPTPQPKKSLWRRSIEDLQSIASSVPRIPGALIEEVRDLPKLPAAIQEATASGSLADQITALSQAPGIRFLPGAYTVGQLADKGPAGLFEHPVYTVLDVLPFAKNPAKKALTPIAKRIGASDAAAVVRSTRPAQLISETFGKDARELAQMEAAAKYKVGQQSTPEGPTKYLDTEVARAGRAAAEYTARYQELIPEPRRIELTKAMELDRLPDGLSDIELGFVEGARLHADELARVGPEGAGKQWLDQIDGETYIADQAKRIRDSRRNTQSYRALVDAKQVVLDATPGNLPEYRTGLVLDENLSRNQALDVAEAYVHALDRAGYDASIPLRTVRDARHNRAIPLRPIAEQVEYAYRNPVESPLLGVEDIVSRLAPFARRDPAVARVLDHVRRGDFKAASKTFRTTIAQRVKGQLPESEAIQASLTRYREHGKFLSSKRIGPASLKTAEKLARKTERLESTLPPARFIPLIEERVTNKLLEKYHSDPEATRLIEEGFFNQVKGLDGDELNRMYGEVVETWKHMRDVEGLDPVFIHRVSPSAVRHINNPTVDFVLRTPSQVKDRTWDWTPYVHDATVAVSHMGMEYLERMGSQAYVTDVIERWGSTEAAATERYVAAARRGAERDPTGSAATRATELMRGEWEKYDPETIFGTSQARLHTMPNDDIWIPKTIARNMERMFKAKDYKVAALTDPVLKVFRTSILPLAPRWHINNIGGGAIMTAAQTGPGVLKFIGEAWRMAKTGELHHIDGMPPAGMGSMSMELIEWNKKATFSDRVAAAHAFKGGQTMRRLSESTKPAREGFNNLIEKSYRFNQFFDDFYRSLAYLYGNDKAITKGLSKEAAQQSGIALVRKTMQQWDRMTPLERTIMRSVFPFYGWANHILRFAYRYPIDHPYRVAITASIARAELEDLGSGLPQYFLDSFFLGHPDKNGNVTALNLGGINPFRDVANYFTIAGFTGNVNPLIGTVLQSLGINPGKGSQDLFPDLQYDSTTGRLVAKNPGLLQTFVGSVMPQSRVLMGLVQSNSEFKEILRTNPEAAASMLRSNLGLPVMFRTVNPPQEQFKTELARQELENRVRNEALRTGNWGPAEQFPGLKPLFDQLGQLQQTGALSAYAPGVELPTTLDAAQRALITMNAP